MKNYLTFIIIFFSLLFVSCKHCIECRIEYTSVTGDTVKLMEKCGKKKITNEFEENAHEIADTLNGTITCTEQ